MPNPINISMEVEAEDDSVFQLLPDSILLNIFFYLDSYRLEVAGRVCRSWCRVSRDEFLWRQLFERRWRGQVGTAFQLECKTKGGATMPPANEPGQQCRSWRQEYIRLLDRSPTQESEVLSEHKNQVLHVCFSHDGQHFATCSKDGFVKLWSSSYPATVKCERDMKEFTWKYTQFSQFNESDVLLLVSGVHQGVQSTSGEIAVFNMDDGRFVLQCRVQNKPYDIFGTWYSENHLLSGDLRWLGHFVSSSILWLNKASQDVDSEHKPVVKPLLRFYNKNASSIRTIMVANCRDVASDEVTSSTATSVVSDEPRHVDKDAEKTMARVTCEGHYVGGQQRLWQPHDGAFCPLCHGVEGEHECDNAERCLDWQEHLHLCDQPLANTRVSSTSEREQSSDTSSSGDAEEDRSKDDDVELQGFLDCRDKYLIFTTGSKTYTPHQIGFKRIRPFKFGAEEPLNLKDKLDERRERDRLERERNNNPDPAVINWPNEESVHHLFDKADHYIDLHGHIIGMALSPDHRFLYVNSRSWPEGYHIEAPLSPPPLAREIEIHVIDLETLKEVGTVLRSHQAFTPNDECFFIFLDVSDEYVASGAEDKHGYLWDRHYGLCLAKFPHTDVVNSVAFNPCNPEMAVTASDDFTLKVWRSKHQQRIIERSQGKTKSDDEQLTTIAS